jgi:hypothetical protein
MKDIKHLVGTPQFHQSIFYAYNRRTHSFMFYAPIQGRELVPIGMFSPLTAEDIPYDPQEIVEGIADMMSQSDTTFDFEFDEEN